MALNTVLCLYFGLACLGFSNAARAASSVTMGWQVPRGPSQSLQPGQLQASRHSSVDCISWADCVRRRRTCCWCGPVDRDGGSARSGGSEEADNRAGARSGGAADTNPMDNSLDHMVSALSGNGQVVVRAVTARNLVQDALVRQDLRPLAADALGRVMICTLLMAGGLKVELPLKDNGNQDVAKGIGPGLLKVVRNHPDYLKPYSGIVDIKNGEVAYDAASYLSDSEQKSCAIAAGCFVTGALVRGAGGWILETLPDASRETEKKVVENVSRLLTRSEDPSELMGRGYTPARVVESLLDGLGGVSTLTYKRPTFACHCSDERVYRALRLISKDEIRKMLEKEEFVEVRCEFCGREYRLTSDDIVRELQLDE